MAAYPTRSRRRANGEGSIYPYRGRWRGALTWIEADGRRQRRTVSAKTQAEARRALAELRAQLDRGIPPPKATHVAPYLEAWLSKLPQHIRPATVRAYQQVTRSYIVPALGGLRLDRLTPGDVERMTAALIDSGRSARTAHTTRSVLRRALADALRDGLVARNAAALAKPPHVPQRALKPGRDYLAGDDLRRLIRESRAHPLGPLVTLAVSTGLRQGELLGLAWDDIDMQAGTLTVRRALARSESGFALAETKTERSRRTVHLPTAATVTLQRQQALQEAARAAADSAWQNRDNLVFTDRLGRPLRQYDVNHVWHRLLTALGLPSVPFHATRHSFATAALAGGTPLKVVSDALGHSTITLTADTYAATVPAQFREAADAIDRALAGVEA